MKNSKIGWTHHTLNFWWGCEKVSTECTHCYIGSIMKRARREPFGGPLRTIGAWSDSAKLNRLAKKNGIRERVFTCSMSDFFHPGADAWRGEAWQIIRDCDQLDWLVLTKRPELIAERLPSDWGKGYSNVWLGVTAGANSSLWRVEKLLETPAKVRFVSAEPLLEEMDFTPYLKGLDWIITGCEQAGKAKRRPMDLDWVRRVDRDCRGAGVPHFFKQYYIQEMGTPVTDGVIDNVVRQEYPVVVL